MQQSFLNLIKAGLWPVFFLFSLSLFAETNLSTLAQDPYWHKLLHYRTSVFGVKSEIDAEKFFLSPKGKSQPEEELRATIDQAKTQTTVCQFPARYKWLNEKGVTNVQFELCQNYLEWKKGLNAQGLSLIFASYYPENPASAFGHLFLKVNQDPLGKNSQLDYVINFAAMTEQDGGLMYAMKGLLGGYKGFYSIEKYYQKIQEYEFVEARDLWEYPLNLNSDEINRVINHLWELTYSAYFDYYFLDENCSYQLLKLLELANDKKLEGFLSFYQIPEENLHQVVDPTGLKVPANVRVSLYKQTITKIEQLSSNDKKIFHQTLKGKTVVKEIQSPAILDALSSYLQFKQFQKRELSENDKKLKHQILVQLSKQESPEVTLTKLPHSPLLGHRSARVALGAGTYKQDNFATFKGRLTFHDMMDDDRGFLTNSSLNLMTVDTRYYEKSRRFKLNELLLLETQVLSPFTLLSSKPSWGLDLSLRSPYQFNCDYCLIGQAKAMRGLSTNFLSDQVSLFAFVHAQIQTLIKDQSMVKRFRYGPQLEMGGVLRLGEKLKWKSAIIQDYNFTEDFWFESIHHLQQLGFYLNARWSLNLDYRGVMKSRSPEIRYNQESAFSTNFFF